MRKYRIALFAIAILAIVASCNRSADISENARETITIRNLGADIPAYVYGNTASKAFIIIVHGGPGGNGLEYRGYYSKELEKDYAVVYTDQRGQGSSHGHYSKDDVTIDNMVSDLEVLFRALKDRYGADASLFMMGHSWGGTLGSAYMIKDDLQFLLNGWIEVDGAHDIPMLNRAAIGMYIEYAKREIAAGKNADKWQEILDFASAVDTTKEIPDSTGGRINQYGHEAEGLLDEVVRSELSSGDAAGLFRQNMLTSTISGSFTSGQLNAEVEATSLTDQLYKIEIPSLFLWGRHDFVVPPRLAATGYQQISSTDKKLVYFEQSGHSPMDNEPEKFIQEVQSFVEAYK